jgi:hypothetical protein
MLVNSLISLALLTISLSARSSAQYSGNISPHRQGSGANRFSRPRVSSGIQPMKGGQVISARSAPSDAFFLPGITYDAGDVTPASIAVGDLDGDGIPDLVVTGMCNINCAEKAGVVQVLLGTGGGAFQPPVTYASAGDTATAVAVADVNGDHIPDVLVANNGQDRTVGVLLGNGDGTFRPVTLYKTGWGGANSIAVADLNADGKPDLIVGSDNDNAQSAVSVLLGNGDGTFRAAKAYQSGGDGTYSIAVIDLNGDGKLDVVVSNICNPDCTSSLIGVFLGNGDGTLRAVVDYDISATNTTSLAVADLNGDGVPDVVANAFVFGSNTGSVAVLLGRGDGTLDSAVLYDSLGEDSGPIAVWDVNGDGHADILITNSILGSVDVLLGIGDGTFQADQTYPTGGSNPIAIVSADLNGDNLHDIAVAECALSVCGNDRMVGILLHVGASPTSTSLVSSLNPSVFGQLVTFSASVTASDGIPTGTVKLFDGATFVGSGTLQNGTASIGVSALSIGSHAVTAVYQGSLQFSSSTSSPVQQVVNQGVASTSTVLTSSPNPARESQLVTFTATVSSSGGVPPDFGVVTFFKGTNAMGSAYLINGSASSLTWFKNAGVFSLTAVYFGGTNFGPSTSAPLLQVVDTSTQALTQTTLLSSLNPSTYGQRVTLSASVTTSAATVPTGKVSFRQNGQVLGAANLNSAGVANLTLASLNVGIFPVIAIYFGDPSNGASVSQAVNQVVNQATSTTTLSSSPNPSTLGQTVTFTAKITSPTVKPTGPVTFTAGKTVLGTAQISGGTAILTTSALSSGSTTVTATYNGNSNVQASSASVTQTVN